MSDVSFQMFSPLRTPVRKKKKKDKDEGPGHSPGKRAKVPIVPSSDAGSDTDVDTEILQLATRICNESLSTPTWKRKNSDSSLSPNKKAHVDRKSTQHTLSDSDHGEVSESHSQIILPGARRKDSNGADSPELFSDLDSEPPLASTSTLTSLSKRQIHSQQVQSNLDVRGSQRELTQADSSIGSSSGSESDSQNGSQVMTPTQLQFKPVRSDWTKNNSESDVEPLVHTQVMEPSQRKRPTQSKTSQAETLRHGTSSSSSEDVSDSDNEPTQLSGGLPQDESHSTEVHVAENAMRYVCPLGFKEVEFEESALMAEDIGEDDEIWLVRVPDDYDVSKLDGGCFVSDTVVHLGQGKDSYEMHSARSKVQRTSLLLPSRADKKLHYAGQVVGQVWVSESLNIPPIVMPKPKPPRDTSLPSGLKYRHTPFGAGPLRTQAEVVMSTKRKKSEEVHREEVHGEDVLMKTQEMPEVLITEEPKKKKKKKKKRSEEEDGEVVVVETQVMPEILITEEPKKKKKKKKRSKEMHAEDVTVETQEIPEDLIAEEPTNLITEEPKKKKKKKKKRSEEEEVHGEDVVVETQEVTEDLITKEPKKKKKKHKKEH